MLRSGGINFFMVDFFEIFNLVFYANTKKEWVVFLCVVVGLIAVVYALQSVGLYVLAKRSGLPRWMAFVPFCNSYLLAKLAGECSFFNIKVKKCDVLFVLSDAVYSVAALFSFIPKLLLRDYYVEVNYYYEYSGYPETLAWADVADTVMGYVLPVLGLVYLFFSILVLFSFFRKYATRYTTLFTFASVLSPIKGILIFAVRNNAALCYEEYVNAQREAYYRQQRQYEQYRRKNDGNTSSNNSAEQKDPFEEFYGSDDGRKSQYSDNDEFFR